MSRISAEFESPETAETVLMRIRNSVPGVFRTGVIYNRRSDRAEKMRNGSIYTVIPTAVTSHNYFTASTLSPASVDVIPEPDRDRTARGFVICDTASAGKVCALLNSFGGIRIRSEA